MSWRLPLSPRSEKLGYNIASFRCRVRCCLTMTSSASRWDNRCILHRASGGYDGHERLLHRTTIGYNELVRS